MFHQFRPVCPRLITAVGFALMGPLTMSTDAATLLVPSQHSTISAAISAAGDNDIIEVADGTYSGSGNRNLILNGTGKTLTIRSAGGSSKCTIDCDGAAAAFVFIVGNDSTIQGFTIVEGVAPAGQAGLGGAMYVYGSSPTIESCVFQSNSATAGTAGKGGAAMVLAGSTASFVGCSFVQNAADLGGAASVDDSYTVFINCLFQRNSADTFGGAVHVFNGADVELINCTLGGNEVDVSSGEGTAVSSDDSALTVTNCIAWHNIGPGSADTIYESPTPTADVNYSDIEGYTGSGTGNIDEDPLFISLAGGLTDDNFRLQPLSPCRNEGDNTVFGSGVLDLDLDDRILYTTVDMGCYEYRCVADLTEDCHVDDADFDDFIDAIDDEWTGDSEYLPYPPYRQTDLNRDRKVNGDDLIAFVAGWGACPDTCSGRLTYPGEPTFTGSAEDTWQRDPDDLDQLIPVELDALGGSLDSGDFEVRADIPGYGNDILLRDDDNDSGATQLLYTGGSGLAITMAVSAPDDQGQADPYGFDVKYTITNPTTSGLELPSLSIPGHQLKYSIQALALGFGAHFVTPTLLCGDGSGDPCDKECTTTPCTLTITDQNTYPANRYAPVQVALGKIPGPSSSEIDVAIGVSVKYPVLQYQHDVSVMFWNSNGTSDLKWRTSIHLRERSSDTPAMIGPGETRIYTVSVRYAFPTNLEIGTDFWIHTLKPYRDYFWTMYGNQARYAQDLRPIWGYSAAQSSLIERGNERGFQLHYFAGQEHYLHEDGWEHLACHMLKYLEEFGRFERLVIWVPSGLYDEHPENNYPPQMMTDWPAIMVSTEDFLLDIPGAGTELGHTGIELGYWWGRAAQYADQWNDDVLADFDMTNSTHVDAALAEVDLAWDRGGTTIGMDTLRQMDAWDALAWVTQLQELYPGIRFVAEPQCCDILHLHMPFATDFCNLTTQCFPTGPTPHAPLLSDYLVPGRETWILLTDGTATPEHAYLMLGWGLTPVHYYPCHYIADELCEAVKCAAQNELNLAWKATVPGSVPTLDCGSATNPFTEAAYICPSGTPGTCTDTALHPSSCCTASCPP